MTENWEEMFKKLLSFGPSIASTQLSSRKVYCIVSKGVEHLTPKQYQLLQQAYQMLDERKVKVAECEKELCMKFKTKFGGLRFVIPAFEGKLYNHLVEQQARIYGPMAIIDSLKANGKIPVYPFPIFSLHCTELKISTTGLCNAERMVIYDKAKSLGAIVSHTLDNETTHLFTRSRDEKSFKYLRALELNIPAVHPIYFTYIYEAVKEGRIDIDDDDDLRIETHYLKDPQQISPESSPERQQYADDELSRDSVIPHQMNSSQSGASSRRLAINFPRILAECFPPGLRLSTCREEEEAAAENPIVFPNCDDENFPESPEIEGEAEDSPILSTSSQTRMEWFNGYTKQELDEIDERRKILHPISMDGDSSFNNDSSPDPFQELAKEQLHQEMRKENNRKRAADTQIDDDEKRLQSKKPNL